MTIKYYKDLEQGSDEWLSARCGLLTASEMKHIVTPKLKIADNDKASTHLYELIAQRITKYVEPHYISDDMLRGMTDEIDAKIIYAKNYAEVEDMGFITNDKFGFEIGYSPDGLVCSDGLIECKSRRQKYQTETLIEGKLPDEYLIQVQTGLLVSERKWLDFISFSAGLPMFVLRVYPDEKVQSAIIEAATAFEEKIKIRLPIYAENIKSLIPTERKITDDMIEGETV